MIVMIRKWVRRLNSLFWYLMLGAWLYDVGELWRLYRNGKVDVVFYCEHPMHEEYISTTLARCQTKLRCALVVAREHADDDHPLSPNRFSISKKALPFLRAPVVVTATSGLSRLRLPWLCSFRVHMPHSLVSLHMAYPPKAFDGYNVIFCCGAHHEVEIRVMDQMRGRLPRKVVPVGYGKMDVLRQAYAENCTQSKGGQPEVKTVVIAPSWGQGNLLESLVEDLVPILMDGGYRVVIRPHPGFLTYCRELLSRLERRWASHDRFGVEDPRATNKSLFTADLLISDYSGVAYEYAFLRERPVLFVDVPLKMLNPNWQRFSITPMELALRERVGMVVPPDARAIARAVPRALANGEAFRSTIVAERERYLYNFDDCASVAAAELERIVQLGYERNGSSV